MNPAPLKLAGRPWENEDDLLSHVGQLRSIARQLWRIAEGFTKSLENEAAASLDDAVPDRKKNDGDPAPDSEQLSRLARNAYKDRRRRDRLFGPDLFAEPAWDMLLDLFGQSIGRRNIRTRELLLASMVPATTALRWIGELEDSGLISRRPSLVDKRAHYVDLTDKGMDLMVRYFSQVAAGMTAMASGKDERDADFLEMASVSSSPERLPIALAGGENGRLAGTPAGTSEATMVPGDPRAMPAISSDPLVQRVSRIGNRCERLLRCLLHTPGRSIAIENLVEALCDSGGAGVPSFSATIASRRSVQRSIAHLRRVLTGIGIDDPIQWKSGGYRLSLEAAASIGEKFRG